MEFVEHGVQDLASELQQQSLDSKGKTQEFDTLSLDSEGFLSSPASSPPTSPKLRAIASGGLTVPWVLPKIPPIDHKTSVDSTASSSSGGAQRAAKLWQRVAKDSLQRARCSDPWEKLCNEIRTERAVEHIYDVQTSTWKQLEVFVKIDTRNAVAKGAMRECFQLKMRQADTERKSTKRVELANWFEIENFDVCAAFKGIGHQTAHRIATGLNLKCGSKSKAFTVGELLKVCWDSFARVKAEIREHVHNKDMAECVVLELRNLLRQMELQNKIWSMPSINYMAKRYMQAKPAGITHHSTVHGVLTRRPSCQTESTNEQYRVDVVMQEMCKSLAEEYNEQEPVPPKLIDFLHVGLVELVNRPGSPVFGYESYVTGDYHKWNTNAGWVDVDRIRHTPHAFSFFTFRHTKGKLMVVDMQGVADLYTDPQIHTADGEGFGDGNLGPRGMALFFNRFKYSSNPVVQYLGLEPFALAPGEQGAPTRDESLHFQEGKGYLESDKWKARARRLGSEDYDISGWKYRGVGSEKSIDTAKAPDAQLVTESATVESLVSCDSPRAGLLYDINHLGATVHEQLAKLHDEDDARVMENRTCTKETAVEFHYWWAARLGHLPSIERCARRSACSETLNLELTLGWWNLAAARGSRIGMVEAGKLKSELQDLGEIHDAVKLFEQATLTEDGMSEIERKTNFVECNYEVLERRARLLHEKLNKTEEAIADLQRASELAMEIGLYKVSEKLQQRASVLNTEA